MTLPPGKIASLPPPNKRYKYSPTLWPKLLTLVEAGESWMEAGRQCYPGVPDETLVEYLKNLKSHSQAFRKFMSRWSGPKSSLKVKNILEDLETIFRFNIADMFEYDAATEHCKLNDDWLKKAKEMNVLNKISVKTYERTDAKTGNVTKTQQIDVEAYSRLAAVSQFCKLKGFYGDTKTSKDKNTVTNNTFLVGQINSIRDNIKNGKVPAGALPAIDAKYLDTLVNAKIVGEIDKEADERSDDD